MKDDCAMHALREYYRKIVEDFDNNRDEHNKVLFSEYGFSYTEDSCDGFCPECPNVLNCETYEKIKDGWRLFYS
ncbi:hypothetical protein BMS3Bbin05_00028 [bacterium BMS3Bbin05]|nr:hypothetical protein BMS3Bbin05_00028 [bacterium BMS3Bbin05]HDO22606.1 hypothetical protein [Nitrospirota bacterium]HDZ88905.1 hypothetical protein [Nitrospirota bacterium]